jgi:hypothetical protein
MAFPSISSVTDAVKAMVAGGTPEATTETETEEVTTPTTPAEPAATTTTTTQEPEKPAETISPEPVATTISKLVTEKGAAAFLADLPKEVKEQLGPELNKEWYRKLNERDAENRRLSAQMAEIPGLISKVVADQFDVLRMESMSEDEKKAYLERKELAALREQKDKKAEALTPQEEAAMVAAHPATQEFWRIVTEAGLPATPNDPRVASIWREAFHEKTPAEAVAKMRTLAATHKAKPEAKPQPEDIEAIVQKRVAESLEAALDKKLKGMGLLKSDTGKPGASVNTSNRPKNYDDARSGAIEMLRAAER